MEKREGEEGFVWWHGVVEDVKDPLKLGRCRVRCVGYHTASKSNIKTSDLPWATPLQSIVSAAVSGIGMSPTGLVQGSHVFGFFRDGKEAQMPVILGSFAGVPTQKFPTSAGFSDPDGKYPLEEETEHGTSVLGESDVSRLARGEKTDQTIIQSKKDGTVKGVSTAGGGSWDEPETPYETEYPFNKVFQTSSGHICEFDDTNGKERIHLYHRSGTFFELHPDGSIVQKVIKDRYQVVLGDDYVNVKGNVSVTVEGDALIKVDGETKIESTGKTDVQCESEISVKSNQQIKMDAPIITLNASNQINGTAGAVAISGGASQLDLNNGGLRMTAPSIDLN